MSEIKRKSCLPLCALHERLNECYAVVKHAKEHPEELGIDPDRIAVGGHSAGGNFSAGICLMENERKALGIKCLMLDYPPMDVYTDAGEKPQPKGSIPNFMSRMFDACYCNDKEARRLIYTTNAIEGLNGPAGDRTGA